MYILNNVMLTLLSVLILASCSQIVSRSPSSSFDFSNREFNSHRFAEEVVSQIEDDPSTAKKLDPKFYMAFDFENINSIDQRGFLNMFSTDDSNGSVNFRKRTKVEYAMAGIRYDVGVGPKELRPK